MASEPVQKQGDLTTINLEEETKEKNEYKNENDLDLIEDLKEHYVYTISGVKDKRYLCNNLPSNWTQQNSKEPVDALSLFEFIPCTEQEGFWYIRNTHNNRWLSYGERKGELYMVGLYTFRRTASKWQIIPFPPKKPTGYILKCFFNDKCRGYLGYEATEKWNKLHTEWSKACIYRFSLAQYGDHFIQNGAIYAIICYGKYISYSSLTGYCAQKKQYKIDDCSFRFIRGPNEDTWFIQNMYEDSKQLHWLSYSRTFDKCWALYAQQSDRAIWKFIPSPKSMEFKIQCIYDNKVIGWSHTPIEHDETVRIQQYHSSVSFKLQLKSEINEMGNETR